MDVSHIYVALASLAVGLLLGFRWGLMHVGMYRNIATTYAREYLRTFGIEWTGKF